MTLPPPQPAPFGQTAKATVPELAGPFYQATCHPPLLSRRGLLTGGAAFAASTALLPRTGHATDDGTAIVRQWAGVPDDPWAVCHGVRAMGRDFKLKDGRRAVDWLLETQLTSIPINGKSVLAFPLSVEAHPNMFLKTLLEAGVPLGYKFTHQKSVRTLSDVVEGAHALFRPGQVITQPNLLPWSIIAFARTSSPERTWRNAWGEHVDFELVIESALRLDGRGVAAGCRGDAGKPGRVPKGTGARVHVWWRAHALRAADGGADGPR